MSKKTYFGHAQELLELHALGRLHVRIVDARVEQNDRVGEHVDRLLGTLEQTLAGGRVAFDVARREGASQMLDFLRLTLVFSLNSPKSWERGLFKKKTKAS